MLRRRSEWGHFGILNLTCATLAMTTSRPLLGRRIDELERMHLEALNSVAELEGLAEELRYRSTSRAAALARKVRISLDKVGREARRRAYKDIPELELAPMSETESKSSPAREALVDSKERARLGRIFERLRERLLDLRLSNPMLNYRHSASSKSQLQIIDEIPEHVYRLLALEGAALTLVPLPEPAGLPADEQTDEFKAELAHAMASDLEYLEKLASLEEKAAVDDFSLAEAEAALRVRLRDKLGLPARPNRQTLNPVEHARSLGIEPAAELQPEGTKEKHRDRKLQTLKWPDVLDATLEKIADRARLAEQEMGLSTLFLVFAFLEWTDSKDSAKRLLAPLILLPVRLEVAKGAKGRRVYSLSATASSGESNLVLQKKLSEANVVLPEFLIEDGVQSPIESYLGLVSEAIKDKQGWRISRKLTLGHFAFGRLAMFADLSPDNWSEHPATTPLVSTILRGTEYEGDGGSGLMVAPEDHSVDDPEIERIAPYLVMDADGSQHSAVIDAMSGQNLVVQGPPGTGKSQTISNIIANALAAGKSVLFLAEKMAALEVVKRRLDSAGLGDFCLELHSDKSSPKQVVQSIIRRHELGYRPRGGRADVDIAWQEARRDIQTYLNALHSDGDTGNPFVLFWRAIQARGSQGDLISSFRDAAPSEPILDTMAGFERAEALLARYVNEWEAFQALFGAAESSPWAKLTYHEAANAGLAFVVTDNLRDIAALTRNALDRMSPYAAFGWKRLDAFDIAVQADAELPEAVPSDEWLARLEGSELADVRSLIDLVARRKDVLANTKSIPGFNVSDTEQVQAALRVCADLTPVECKSTPRNTYAKAQNVREAAPFLGAILPEARKFLSQLQLRESFPFEGMTALQALAGTLVKIEPDIRAWVIETNPDHARFAELTTRLSELVADEAYWRSRFPQSAPAWPAVEVLNAVQVERNKTGLFSRLMIDRGLIASTHALLGLPPTLKIAPEDYGRLAAHISGVFDFLNSLTNQQSCGRLWRGLQTPATAMMQALETLAEVKASLASSAAGELLANTLRENGASFTEILLHEINLLERWDAMPEPAKEIARGLTVDNSTQQFASLRSRSEQILASDPSGRLSSCEGTWDEINSLIEQDSLVAQIDHDLTKHRLSGLVQAAYADLDALQHAAEWLASVALIAAVDLRTGLARAGAGMLRSLLARGISDCAPAVGAVRQRLAALEQETGIGGLDPSTLTDFLELTTALSGRRDELSAYLGVRSAKQEVANSGLGKFLAKAEQLDIPISSLPHLFTGLVAQLRGERIRRSDPVLSRASGAKIGVARSLFVERDRQKIQRDRNAVYNAVIGKKALLGSNFGPRKTWTEGAFLNNEMAKEKAFRPVRELIKQAGNSLQALKPCFMMSPLSLAKFVPAQSLSFDLLVVDEASQMRPEDALGGLLRARQVIVVGDPRQLPPSDFFQRVSADAQSLDGAADDDVEDEDDESILEACQKSFRNLRQLKWHYRSRCESLIAFSNRHIYAPEGRALITFPSSRPGSFSIDRIRLKGSFLSGRSAGSGGAGGGVNAAEAQRIAEEAVRFMRENAKLADPPSLGLIAMNAAQAELIQEELRQRAAGDDLVDEYRLNVARMGEPLFVKNLENVQGDERDYILISMTYGPRPGETVVLNRFGPITKKQGHRRLNVLFTRARMRIGIVTSMDSSDIRPTEASSRGVHLLKAYLAYAETAGREEGSSTGHEPDSDFEIYVADRLKALGYRIEYQVGVSGFRVDLGVIDPVHGDRFLAGIECDGARYHSSKSARDRDRLRQEVLEGLGWRIIRVWSTDWFDNPDIQIARLKSELERLSAEEAASQAIYEFHRSQPPLASDAPLEKSPEGTANAADLGEDVVDHELKPDPPAASAEPIWHRATFSPKEAAMALAAFRDQVIASGSENWDPERSVLRASMIEAFVGQRIAEPQEWFKVPQYLRLATSGPEKQKYIEEICDIVARIRN